MRHKYQMIQRLFSIVLCLCSLATLTGCAAAVPGLMSQLFGVKSLTGGDGPKKYGDTPAGPKINLKKVTLSASIDANNDSAVVIHLVAIHEARLIRTFESLSSRQYFMKFQQLRLNYPGMFEVMEWQLTPGQSAVNQKVRAKKRPIAMFVFADYVLPGVHRARVGEAENLRVSLERQGFKIFYSER